jgi:hypothetical protein
MKTVLRLVDSFGVPVAGVDLGEPGTAAFDQLCEWSARYAGTGADLRPVMDTDQLGGYLRDVATTVRPDAGAGGAAGRPRGSAE